MPSDYEALFRPCTLGNLNLPNRIVMAPLTRSRSQQPGDIPWELNATYYAQRAGAGLIIAEATQVSPQGKGDGERYLIDVSSESISAWVTAINCIRNIWSDSSKR